MSVKKMTVEPSITVVDTPIDGLVLSSANEECRTVKDGVTVFSPWEELGMKLEEASRVIELCTELEDFL